MQYQRLPIHSLLLFLVSLILLAAIPMFAVGIEKPLYNFCSLANCPDGDQPVSGVIADAQGNLYGTTFKGGAHGLGAVFELSHGKDGTWKEKVLYSFRNTSDDGHYPTGGLVFDAQGNLYGTTESGGMYAGNGIAFELSQTKSGGWAETIIFNFQNGKRGSEPQDSMIFDSHGNLYGTTEFGGTNDGGTVFELTPHKSGKWSEKVLHSFLLKDGYEPRAGLVLDKQGNLFGVTLNGGDTSHCEGYGCGVVFEMSPGKGGLWTEKVIHSFVDNGTDGMTPWEGLTLDAKGNLYGTTSYGGPNYSGCEAKGCGVVFMLAPDGKGNWTEKIIHNFNPANKDGQEPISELLFDSHGALYGTTFLGGTDVTGCQGYGCGTVFKLMPTHNGEWTEKLLYNFLNDGSDGESPSGGIVLDGNGDLFGTTFTGGSENAGTIFQYTP